MSIRVPRWSMLLAFVVSFALPSLAGAQCQPGTYASASTGSCEPCDLGRYQPAIGQEACFECEAGRFADSAGRTACDACGVGRYGAIRGLSSCSSCDAGNFRDATGQTSCVSCGAGRFSDVIGSTMCQECSIGKYAGVAGVTACATCDPGYVSARGSTACQSCPAGEWASSVDLTCKSCSPGKYSATAGATACLSCSPGKYSGVTVDPLGDAHYASTCTTPNSYNCYKTKDLKDPPFQVGGYFLVVDDRFSSGSNTTIKGPAMVCAPVDTGSGVEDASASQCCYKVAAKGLPKPHPRVVTTDGPFTGSTLEPLKSQLICTPCGTVP